MKQEQREIGQCHRGIPGLEEGVVDTEKQAVEQTPPPRAALDGEDGGLAERRALMADSTMGQKPVASVLAGARWWPPSAAVHFTSSRSVSAWVNHVNTNSSILYVHKVCNTCQHQKAQGRKHMQS
jgi:hypothetical protein